MKNRAFKIIQFYFTATFLLLLFTIALYVLSIRFACFYISENKADFESKLSLLADRKVRFKSVDTSWIGFDPVLDVNGVSVAGAENAYIGRIRVQLSFIKSLQQLTPVLERVYLDHAELSAHQGLNGAWSIATFNSDHLITFSSENNALASSDINADYSFLIKLLGQTRFQLNDLLISIHNNQGHVRSLRLPQSLLAYENNKAYINGKVLEKESSNTLVNFSLESEGVLGKDTLQTKIYLEARSPEFIGQLLKVYQWENISVDNIEGNVRIWVDVEGYKPTAIQGQVQVSEMNWRSGHNSLVPISNLVTNFKAELRENQTDILLDGLKYRLGQTRCASSDALVNIANELVKVRVSALDLGCSAQLVVMAGLSGEGLSNRLEISSPSGVLENIDLVVDLDKKQASFDLNAELKDVALLAYESTPAGSGINGYLFANEKRGFVRFKSEQFGLAFPTLFLDPWVSKEAEGAVNWGVKENGDIIVKSDGLRLWFDDGSIVYGDFTLLLNDEEHEDYLTLALAMQDIPFPKATDFVPYYEVGEGLYEWLSEALVSGKVASGIYLGYGSVEEESADNSFTSSILLQSKNGTLKFDPNWPPLEELNAQIDLQNQQLIVESPTAKVAGTKLDNIEAVLLETSGDLTSVLNITSTARVVPQQLKYWLEESPIADQTRIASEQLKVEGAFGVDINLNIPVSDGSDHVDMSYSIIGNLKDNRVLHRDSGIQFKRVTGPFEVSSERGVYSEKIDLDAFGQPATLKISTNYDDKTINQFVDFDHDRYEDLFLTQFDLSGSTDIKDVFGFFGYSDSAFMEGEFNYQASLILPNHADSFPVVNVKSDLLGLKREWPAPFNKLSAQKEEFGLNILIKPDQLYLSANLLDASKTVVNSELLFVNQEFSFGEVSINGATIPNPNLEGLNIAANVSDFNANDWISFINKLTELSWDKKIEKHEINKPQQVAVVNQSEGAESLDQEGLIKQVVINTPRFSFADHYFDNSTATIMFKGDRWQVDIDGENISGVIRLANDQNDLDVYFEKLVLRQFAEGSQIKTPEATAPDTTTPETTTPETTANAQENELKVSDIPAFSFQADDLNLYGQNWGKVSFDVERQDNLARFRNISVNVPGASLEGQLTWQVLEQSVNTSILTVKTSGKDIKSVFNLFDLPTLFDSKSFNAELGLTWPGHPMNFGLASISGNVDFKAKDGFLHTDDSDTGILRLFGVLNAEAIARRLKLDFSDLYKSGVGFDNLSMTASIDQGLLSLTSPFTIEGPAGDYQINGLTDLASQTLDMDMLVKLPFTQNVPLAALVLGAPQIGGLVWVADKLLGEPLSALTTSRYDITGTWERPVVELKEAVNASKKERKKGQANRVSPDPQSSTAEDEDGLDD